MGWGWGRERPEERGAEWGWRRREVEEQGLWTSEGAWLTGEHGDVVLVGLVEGVVDDALLIRKTLEDIYAHLWGEASLEPALHTSGALPGSPTLPWT